MFFYSQLLHVRIAAFVLMHFANCSSVYYNMLVLHYHAIYYSTLYIIVGEGLYIGLVGLYHICEFCI